MEPREVLERALAAVVEAKIPDDLREVAFSRAIDLIAPSPLRAHTGASGVASPAPTNGTTNPPADEASGKDATFYQKVSDATGVGIDRLQQLVDIHEDAPVIVLRSSDLPSQAAKAQKVVALIILVARHFYFDETDTPLSTILTECKRLGCDDQNFKRNVTAISNLVVIGNGVSAKAKVRKPLLDSFAEDLRKLGVATE